MLLSKILPNLIDKDNINCSKDIPISGLAIDSRKVTAGDIFFAIKGEMFDGARFAQQAERNGAALIVTYPKGSEICKRQGITIPVLEVENIRKDLSLAACNWFRSQPDKIIAITGTNGKTSVGVFLKQIWDFLGIKSASIGTLGVSESLESKFDMTTPDPLSLHNTLSDLKERGIDYVVLEASSHGLQQSRLDHVNITARAFTNLSRDHLDYHGTMEDYFLAKAILFKEGMKKKGTSVINIDTYYGRLMKIIAESNGIKVSTVGQLDNSKFRILKKMVHGSGQFVSVLYNEKIYNFSINLIGSYQVENIVMAASLAIEVGADADEVFAALPALVAPRGRLELVKEMKNGAKVFIDYAHSPEALKTMLLAIRQHTPGNLFLVFGAGGDRDRGKRKIMGEIADQYADEIFVTDDNPRNEEPHIIREEIREMCRRSYNIADRAEAIFIAISKLKHGDNLVIAGKGHETGQVISGAIYPFNDLEQASMSIELLEKQECS